MNGLAFEVYKTTPVIKKKHSKPKVPKLPPVLPPTADFEPFKFNFDEIEDKGTATYTNDVGRSISPDEDRKSFEKDDAQLHRRRLSSKPSTVDSITSSLSSVAEVSSQDVELPIVQETAEEAARETDIKKRWAILGRLSKLLQPKRLRSQQSTAENGARRDSESTNMFRPTFQIGRVRTKNPETWDTQEVQLDPGSWYNVVSRHYVEVILGMEDHIEPVPKDIGELVGADGSTIRRPTGIVLLTWKGRCSGTSRFLVLDKSPHCILFGEETITDKRLLARPVLTLLHLKQSQATKAQEEESKTQQAAIKAEQAKKQADEQRERRQKDAARKKKS